MVYYKIKLTKIHFRKVTFLTPTRIFSSFSPSVGGWPKNHVGPQGGKGVKNVQNSVHMVYGCPLNKRPLQYCRDLKAQLE